MQVTEVRIKLAGDRDDKLRAFCSITFDDCFVVRDLKIIQGAKGIFVAMPSRKLTDLCPKCNAKNHLRARYCSDCGHALAPDRAERDEKGRAKLHADIAHPIHGEYRDELQRLVLDAYEEELLRAEQPGYQPPSDDFLDLGEEADEPLENVGGMSPSRVPPSGGKTRREDTPPTRREDTPPTTAPPPESKPEEHDFGEGIFP